MYFALVNCPLSQVRENISLPIMTLLLYLSETNEVFSKAKLLPSNYQSNNLPTERFMPVNLCNSVFIMMRTRNERKQSSGGTTVLKKSPKRLRLPVCEIHEDY